MNACEQAVQSFSALLDGEISPEEADELDRHLAACDGCRREARRLAVLNRLSLEIVLEEVSRGKPQASRKPVPAKRTTRRAAPSRHPARRPMWIAAAAAAAVVMALIAWAARSGPPPASPVLEVRKPAEDVRKAEETKRQRERELRETQERLAELDREQKRLAGEKQTAERDGQAERLAAERRKMEADLARRKEAEAAARAALEKAEEARRKAEEAAEIAKAEAARAKAEADAAARPSAITRTDVVKLHSIAGEVFIVTEAGRVAAKPGQGLASGQDLETGPSLSWATVVFEDGTRMEISAGSKARLSVGEDGKRVFVSRGVVAADVAKQPAGRPMIFTSAHGEAKVLGTSLRIIVDPDPVKGSIRVDVEEGKVQVKRNLDGKTVDVAGGHYAVAAVGADLKSLTIPLAGRKKRHAGIDSKSIDDAIWRGIASLREPMAFDHWNLSHRERMVDFYEIVLWALIQNGIPERDPLFEGLLQRITQMPLKSVYHTSLQAMILEQVHRVKYQVRIGECAQYLVDNQLKNGSWDRGEATPIAHKEWAAPSNVKESNPFLPVSQREKPPVSRRLTVLRRREARSGPASTHETLYAALGLKACIEAGITLDSDVVQKAAKWWRDNAFSTADPALAGWGEGAGGAGEPHGYATAGGAESLIHYDRLLGVDWTKDKQVLGALKWLGANFSATEVPKAVDGNTKNRHYEYLWAVERLADLCGLEKIDAHDWYAGGAKVVLAAQEPGGSWGRGEPHYTSMAVLFLRRATRPLVEISTEDRSNRR